MWVKNHHVTSHYYICITSAQVAVAGASQHPDSVWTAVEYAGIKVQHLVRIAFVQEAALQVVAPPSASCC